MSTVSLPLGSSDAPNTAMRTLGSATISRMSRRDGVTAAATAALIRASRPRSANGAGVGTSRESGRELPHPQQASGRTGKPDQPWRDTEELVEHHASGTAWSSTRYAGDVAEGSAISSRATLTPAARATAFTDGTAAAQDHTLAPPATRARWPRRLAEHGGSAGYRRPARRRRRAVDAAATTPRPGSIQPRDRSHPRHRTDDAVAHQDVEPLPDAAVIEVRHALGTGGVVGEAECRSALGIRA